METSRITPVLHAAFLFMYTKSPHHHHTHIQALVFPSVFRRYHSEMMIVGGSNRRKASIDRNISNTAPNDHKMESLPRANKKQCVVREPNNDNTRDSLSRFLTSVQPVLPGWDANNDIIEKTMVSHQISTKTIGTKRQRDVRVVKFATPLISTKIPPDACDDDTTSDDIISKSWYSQNELDQIDKKCMETIRLIQSGKIVIRDDDSEHCKRGLESRLLTTRDEPQIQKQKQIKQQQQQVEQPHSTVTVRSSSPSSPLSTSRNTTRCMSKEDIISIVLDTQIDMWSSGITCMNDHHNELERVLCETYKLHSSHHVFKAIVRALHDWSAVSLQHEYNAELEKKGLATSTRRSTSSSGCGGISTNSNTSSSSSLVKEIARIASATATNRPLSLVDLCGIR